jgi:RNA polymerase sigma-70 factor (ECF subfamily)
MSESIPDSPTLGGNPADEHDLALLRRIADQRDKAALTALYARYFHTLQRFLYRVTNDRELAEEGINDVMLVVWNKAGTFSGRSKPSTWIFGIAYRKGLKLAQRATRWTSRFKAADWTDAVEPFAASAEQMDSMVARDLVGQALKALSPKHRAVVELTYMQGFSYDEIATILDCPVNTVKTRMFHARARLRQLVPALGRDEIEP